ncbi:MAG: ATP-binding protein, partial [Halobacteriaceae archaeon]
AVEHGSTSPEANAPRDAVEHGSTAAQPVTITVEYVDRDDEDRVRIEIADEGPGIPDHVLRALEAERETPLEHTTGLGLWLAQWVVTLSGGTLAFDTDDSRGTVVAVELPTPESNPDG